LGLVFSIFLELASVTANFGWQLYFLPFHANSLPFGVGSFLLTTTKNSLGRDFGFSTPSWKAILFIVSSFFVVVANKPNRCHAKIITSINLSVPASMSMICLS